MSGTCPICKTKSTSPAFKPFCSKRCGDVDLNRWFTGGYTIPTEESVPAESLPGEQPEATND